MRKKPHKVEEPAAPYAVESKSTKPGGAASTGIRYAELAAVGKSNAKLMQVHRKVLHKLAQ